MSKANTKASPRGVDFHCHLDLFPDHEAAIERAEKASIYTLTVTTTPRAWLRNHSLTRDRRFVRAALGLHPQLVGERENELALWEHHLPETRYVGEVGLDAGPRFYKTLDAQKRVFRRVLECCADAGDKVLTVHSVRAATPVLDMIETFLPSGRGKVVLHWFTGSRSEARRALELGCYFSVNAAMAAKDRGRELIGTLPSDRVLTETDGPFTQGEDGPAQPNDVRSVVAAIARIRDVPEHIAHQDMIAALRTLVARP
ncbi:Qat anti-phage system TatD family nuclease QatD [Sphingomonas sp. Leaf28]|uniref:Qat anti-phage system TatD family nuclease QatD n=1 Tax=Sphingomonas sp. Leaf28 TaxID=1735695 RepID=UPI0006F6189C|nr:Qat anti-phage system TatD family nuclease QatD [Sphingomonas sp. Leaf28]KQN16120.1 hydrolase TatD [Sphingomonas sp. Leaf28]